MHNLVSHSEHFAINTQLNDIGIQNVLKNVRAIGDDERVLCPN